MAIQVTLPNGAIREIEAGRTAGELASELSHRLGKQAVAAVLNGKTVDLTTPLQESCVLKLVTAEEPEGLEVYRHSTAHLLAQAVKRVRGAAVQLGIGPVIQDGFYYDMKLEPPLTPEELPRIEQEMAQIAAEDWPIRRLEVSRGQALELFAAAGEALKVELIHELPEEAVITLYEQGEFVDLCRGPHVPSTGRLQSFKLLSVAGAYWRGDANNEMLQRIYGTAFPKKAQLEEHLRLLEEAKKRDHRKLGKELELFMFSEEAPGMPFYLPRGMAIRNELESFSRQVQQRYGYEEVRTPFMMNERLWETSGHWEHYKDNMYFTEVDNGRHALKPMNCPGHMLIYKHRLRSYRDLPLRLSEFGQVHRHEYSGALNGMMRVRTFCQDDAHLFVRPDQIEQEIHQVIAQIDDIYAVFGFDYTLELSTRPADSMGEEALWDQAEQALRHVLESRGLAYRINEGDGAFYGPKIDFHISDALGRSWQCATIQLDFQMPEKFGLSYIGEDNQRAVPVVIHRAVYGSLDRFIGMLTEHYGGHFPLWLAPVQVKLLPVSGAFSGYAAEVESVLRSYGIRAEVDAREEKLGYRMREAQLLKAPWVVVLGAKEQQERLVSVRQRGDGEQGICGVEAFAGRLAEAIGRKAELQLQELE